MFKMLAEGLYTDLMPKTNRLMKAGIPGDAIQIDESPGKWRVWWVLKVREDYHEQAMRELGLLIGEES